ncbi:MAG TPA: DNA methyltransferase [Ktedonobacteraceae bacterium]
MSRATTQIRYGSEETTPALRLKGASRRFYKRFKHEYTAFLECFEGAGTSAEHARYASTLLIYTMFLHFLQTKGLLTAACKGEAPVKQPYLLRRLKMLQQEYGHGHFHAFYHALLLHVFGEPRGALQPLLELAHLATQPPYLHSGLIDIAQLERSGRAIFIPDEAYERLLSFFAGFRWSLHNRLPDNPQELHPDIISAIFEKYNPQKQMGIYYTQEDITEYIGKSCIIPRLIENVAQCCTDLLSTNGIAWNILRAEPERYIYADLKHGCALPLPAEIEAGVSEVARRGMWNNQASEEYALPLESWREVVARRQRYAQVKAALSTGEIHSLDELVSYNLDLGQFALDLIALPSYNDLLAACYAGLEELTILDPTCGSGEFLLAAFTILEPLYTACLERIQEVITEQEQQDDWPTDEQSQSVLRYLRAVLKRTTAYSDPHTFIAQTIITKNLYGVDLTREATEICKLRLFLKLLARVETYEELKLLARINFNIRAGNALVGYATESEVLEALKQSPEELLFSREIQSQLRRQSQQIEPQLSAYQHWQTTHGLQSELLVSWRQRLHALSEVLRAALDRYLATQDGLDEHALSHQEEGAQKIARWRESVQPLHWLLEWYEITQRGGFDVIIGNPPYVAYSQVKPLYQLRFYQTQSCANLCAYVLERATTLLRPQGRCGMIVPVSTISSASYRPLSQLLLKKQLWISSYSNRPGKLFAGVEQRLAILLLRNVQTSTLLASAYCHWYEPERAHLFATLSYAPASTWQPTGMPLKSGSAQAEAIFARLTRQQGFPLLRSSQPSATVWVHNGPTYWVRALPFEPDSAQKSPRSNHYYQIPVDSQETAWVLAAILSSSTFYFFYKLVSNCRDLGQKELQLFPLGQFQPALWTRLVELGRELARVLKNSAKVQTRHYSRAGLRYETSYKEYYPARARTVLDKIDGVLAEHYGFSAEELDFLLHYDYKYRQGRAGQDLL